MLKLRSGTQAVIGLAAMVSLGCAHDHPAPTPACSDPLQISLPNCTVGPDRFSDETCATLDDAITNRVTVQDARSASVVVPAEGQRAPRATPLAFAWTEPTALRGRRPAPRAMTLADELRRWTTLLPEAEAHCEPFSGRAYELRFRVNGSTILRRQQSATTWTPDAREWGVIAGGGGGRAVELIVYTALFNNGQVGTGSGPFTPMASRRFVVD